MKFAINFVTTNDDGVETVEEIYREGALDLADLLRLEKEGIEVMSKWKVERIDATAKAHGITL